MQVPDPDQEPAAQQASSSAAPEKAPLLPASAAASSAGAASAAPAPSSGQSQQQQPSPAKQRAYQAPQVPCCRMHACLHMHICCFIVKAKSWELGVRCALPGSGFWACRTGNCEDHNSMT